MSPRSDLLSHASRFPCVRAATLLAFALAVPLAGCSERERVTDPPAEEPLAEATIGVAGGVLEAPGFRAEVPPGAFGATTDLALFATEDAPGLEGSGPAYRVAGLPAELGAPIRLEFAASTLRSGRRGDGASLILGEECIDLAQNELRRVYRFLDATLEDSILVAELPASGTEERASAGARAGGGETHDVTVQPAPRPTVVRSTGGHFRLDVPDDASISDLTALAGFLEAAYDKYLELGFSYARRTRWPVQVSILELPANQFGNYYNSTWGYDEGWLEFNVSHLGNTAAMRVTAGHEFFHFVQGLYDNRNAWSRAKLTPLHAWLNEAIGTWSEEMFTDDPNHVSITYHGREEAPLAGMQRGALETPVEHGYGMSPLIEFLTEREGTDFLVPLYERIFAGDHPVDALDLAVAGEMATWWHQFMGDLYAGRLYPLPGKIYLVPSPRSWAISSAADSVKAFHGGAFDLGGENYRIRLRRADFDSAAALTVTATGEGRKVTVFAIQDSTVDDLLPPGETVTVTGLRRLQAEGWDLLAIVSNARAVEPYLTDSPHTLSLKVVEPSGDFSRFDEIVCMVQVDIWKEIDDGDGGTRFEWQENVLRSEVGRGTVEGLRFDYAVHLRQDAGGGVYNELSGTIEGEWSLDGQKVSVLDVRTDYRHHEPGLPEGELLFHYEATLRDVPLRNDFGGTRIYAVFGEEACGLVESYAWNVPSGGFVVRDTQCRPSSYIQLTFNDRPGIIP